jgi:16S rRNA (adenine1518-N6/adenine1519-N6)-dimethyltransferase
VREGERVLEVGCGAGTLTRVLLDRGCEVLGVEIDGLLCDYLRDTLCSDRFTLIEGDVLDRKNELGSDLRAALSSWRGDYRLVANLPYAVATPVVQLLLGRQPPPSLVGMGVLVQKEVARKWMSHPGDSDYGTASLAFALLGEGRISRSVRPELFAPAPRVDSAFFVWTPTGSLPGDLPEVQPLARLLFQKRRKMLRSILADVLPESDSWWSREALDPRSRPQDLFPEHFVALAREVAARGGL